MSAVIRGLGVYFFLMILFTIAGKRSLAQMDTFDFVLLLIISEAAQNALVGENYSMTYGAILIMTLVGAEILMAAIRQWRPQIEKWTDGGPLILIDRGQVLQDRMDRARVGLDDILTAARKDQGLERLDQVKYAVLERSGEISIIPYETSPPEAQAA